MLADTDIRLRAIEPADINALYDWENLSQYWQASSTLAPYSVRNLMRYIDEYTADPFAAGELRLMIEKIKDKKPVGLIDLYNVEVRHRRACIGIIIAPEEQKRGIATRALHLIEQYCHAHLLMHQLLAAVPAGNHASLNLFLKAGFSVAATLQDYISADSEGEYSDAIIMQKILKSPLK
ncbi:MAG: GNAT family N-acetyltransferase [Prevotella sp.]|nr:GNAT family N-acetyltransferase [Prevotella sp.]MCM1074648.1 GNAT family N-acetyltransferase [Ruminococcus sp.]